MKFCGCIVAFVFFVAAIGVEAQKKDAAYFFEKGEAALDAQMLPAALAHFNECLRLDPAYMEAYYFRAQVRESLNDPKGALTDYSIYLERRPDDSDALFARAQLRYQFRQWKQAREDFSKLLRVPPGETKSVFFAVGKETGSPIVTTQTNMRASILNYLGLIDTHLKEYIEARSLLDSACHLEPANAEFVTNRGWVSQMMADTVEATHCYERALSLDPDGSLARHNLAALKAKKGNLRETEKLLTAAIAENNTEPHYFTARAINYMAQGKLTLALADYDQSIALDSTDADAWLRRGMVRTQMKQFDRALADYAQAIRLDDRNDKIWIQHGNLMLQLNKVDEAVEDFTVAITYHPENGLAYRQRALAHERAGNLQTACADIAQAEVLKIPVEAAWKNRVCH